MGERSAALKQRSITAVFFGIVVIALLLINRWTAALFGLIIISGGAYEYLRLVYDSQKNKWTLSLAVSGLLAIIIILSVPPSSSLFFGLTVASCIIMILGILNLYFDFVNHRKVPWLILPLYWVLPLSLFVSWMVYYPEFNGFFWLSVLILIWISDTNAYFVGSLMGKNKLFEKISPKKTWEGFIGAGVLSLPLAYLLGIVFFGDTLRIYLPQSGILTQTGIFWVVITAFAWIIGTYGDLVESSIKRTFNVKDSGNLLPGHGGILDRFDSFVYILPFVLLMLQWLAN